ncbi:MAG: hypothetical protein RI556_08865, partial [Hydrogenovibrio sp.]|uniref:hypothetical protein n=1 Tax=Hydrogenovibrio sp. TaxID=2065821 RepID=UPI0028707EAB
GSYVPLKGKVAVQNDGKRKLCTVEGEGNGTETGVFESPKPHVIPHPMRNLPNPTSFRTTIRNLSRSTGYQPPTPTKKMPDQVRHDGKALVIPGLPRNLLRAAVYKVERFKKHRVVSGSFCSVNYVGFAALAVFK